MIDDISFKRVNAIQTIDTCDLVKTAGDNTKIDDIEQKIPNDDNYITIIY